MDTGRLLRRLPQAQLEELSRGQAEEHDSWGGAQVSVFSLIQGERGGGGRGWLVCVQRKDKRMCVCVCVCVLLWF